MAQVMVEVVVGKRRLIVNAVTASRIPAKKSMRPLKVHETPTNQFAGWKSVCFKLSKNDMEENLAKLTYIS